MRLALILAALLAALPAQARDLNTREKQQVMTAVRQHMRDPTVKFRWLPVADESLYCGLVNTAKTTGYLPFQVFGMSGKTPKLTVVHATDRTTTQSIRQACERYGYNFTQISE